MGTFPPSLHKLLLSTNIPRIAEKREFSGQAPTFFLFSLSLIFTRKLLGRQVRVGVVQSCWLYTRHNALFPCKHRKFHSSSGAHLQIIKLLQSSSSLWKIQELICFSLVNVNKIKYKSHCSAIKTR